MNCVKRLNYDGRWQGQARACCVRRVLLSLFCPLTRTWESFSRSRLAWYYLRTVGMAESAMWSLWFKTSGNAAETLRLITVDKWSWLIEYFLCSTSLSRLILVPAETFSLPICITVHIWKLVIAERVRLFPKKGASSAKASYWWTRKTIHHDYGDISMSDNGTHAGIRSIRCNRKSRGIKGELRYGKSFRANARNSTNMTAPTLSFILNGTLAPLFIGNPFVCIPWSTWVS